MPRSSRLRERVGRLAVAAALIAATLTGLRAADPMLAETARAAARGRR